MPKYIIVVNGEAEVIEAESRGAAKEIAHQTWLETTEQDYYVEDATKENLVEWDLEDEEDAA